MQIPSLTQTRKSPHKRWVLIQLNKKDEDPIVDRILEDLNDPLYLSAKELLSLKVKRSYIEACLLATDDCEEIGELLEINPEVIDLFKSLFFDLEGFDRLDKLDLISQSSDKQDATLKTWALTQGLDFLYWRLGKVPNVSPIDGLEKIFLDCYFRSREAFYTDSSDKNSPEVVKWVKLSMDAARLVKSWKIDSNAAMKDIKLALTSINPEFGSFDDIAKEEEGLELNIVSPESIFPGLNQESEE